MIRESMLALLLIPLHAIAAEPATVAPAVPAPVVPAPAAVAIAPAAQAPATVTVLPPMKFLASVAEDDILGALKADPAFANLDKELVGSPLSLVVTHTVRPTAAGTAAGLLSAVLSGGTLGILPMVTNDRLVVRYEVMLNGKTVTVYHFERTATRAQSIWTAGSDGTGGLGKGGLEWVKSTAAEVAAKIRQDPALLAVRDEIQFYFPTPATSTAAN